VHDGREQLGQGGEFSGVVGQLGEEFPQSGQIFVVVVGLDPRIFNFLFQLAKWICIGALASLQKSEDALHLH